MKIQKIRGNKMTAPRYLASVVARATRFFGLGKAQIAGIRMGRDKKTATHADKEAARGVA